MHAALSAADGRFRGLGLPLGLDRSETERAVLAQLDAGFAGLRLSGADVRDRPWLLDLLAARGAFPLVCGENALAEGAAALCAYLDATPDGLVVGGHFAGPTDPRTLDTDPAVRDLFAHPRFVVVWSRQGIFPPELLDAWATALKDRMGWERMLWGSEAPVLFWRDEPVRETPGWIERFAPTDAQRTAFFTGNSERLIFARPVPPPALLRMPFDPWRDDPRRDTPMWPFGLSMDTALTGRLVHGWMEWGGEPRGPLRAYLQEVLDCAFPQQPAPPLPLRPLGAPACRCPRSASAARRLGCATF